VSLLSINDDFSKEDGNIDYSSSWSNSDNQSNPNSDSECSVSLIEGNSRKDSRYRKKASSLEFEKKETKTSCIKMDNHNNNYIQEYEQNSKEEEEESSDEESFESNETTKRKKGEIKFGLQGKPSGIDVESANLNTTLESLYLSNNSHNSHYEVYKATALLSPKVVRDSQIESLK